MYEIGKKTEIDELCPTCRNLPWGYGRTIEETLSIMYNNIDKLPATIDDINVMIAGTIWDKYNSKPRCRRCWQLVIDRIPSSRKGGIG
jgi:thymidine kinase